MCLKGQVMPTREESEEGGSSVSATIVQCTTKDDLNFCCSGARAPPAVRCC
jgi:hypothetical protein